jgi:hypothetical protein
MLKKKTLFTIIIFLNLFTILLGITLLSNSFDPVKKIVTFLLFIAGQVTSSILAILGSSKKVLFDVKKKEGEASLFS